MSFYKFSKGKALSTVPNGIGDGSAYFDGSTYAELSDSNLPMGNSARSIVISVYRTGYQGEYRLLFRYGYKADNRMMSLGITENDSILLNLHGNGKAFEFESVPLELNKWWQIVVTYSDGVETLYLNGVKQSTVTHSETDTNSGVLSLGNWFNNTENFQGNMKNLSIYNRVLSAEEVTQLYNKQEISSGRVLHIPLQYGKDDESLFSSKTFVYDYSMVETSSGFDEWGYPIRYDMASECGISYATIPTDNLILYMALKDNRSSPEIVDSDVFTTSYEGNYNSANYQVVDNVPCLYLDSSSSVSLKRVATKTIRQATLSYWGKYTDSSQCIVTNSRDSSGHVNGGAEFWLAFSSTGVYFTSGNAAGNIITANMSISADWHHIAVTWDMDTNYMYLYLDGVLIGECTDQSWLAPNINRSGFILSVNNLYRATSIIYGNGNYSNIRMYDRVLKASEIKALAREF